MKILVVDDHALVREGLRQVLKGLDEQVEVMDAPTCARALELVDQHPDLDLVLLDYHLPDMNGLEALDICRLEHPELPIIMLSGNVTPQLMRQVVARGAAGFVSKGAINDDFLSVVQRVLEGDVYLPPDMLPMAGVAPLDEAAGDPAPPLLTPRQEEVLELLLQGRSNKDISQALQLSEETTKNHVSGVLRAFGVQTRVQAVLAAGRHGYVKSGPSA